MSNSEWTLVKNNTKEIPFRDSVFIKTNSNKYNKNYKLNPDLEKFSFLESLKKNIYFKTLENCENYLNHTNSEQKMLIDNLYEKNISIENMYKIYYKNDITQNLKEIYFNDYFINSFIIVNRSKLLNIIIYKFDDLYGIISFFENKKQRLLLVNTYIELLLYLYKLEIDMRLNPFKTKILNKYPQFFKSIKYQDLIIYFNNFDILWK